MRTFIAIPLDEQAHSELSQLQDRLRKSSADVKWVSPSNIHLTMKFLGEVDDARAEKVKSALGEIAKLHKPFNIRLAKVGAFPRISYPRVIWVGSDEGVKECEALQKDIADGTEKLGFEKEGRPFSTHLTLGRVRSLKNKGKLLGALEKEKDFASQRKVSVNKIILFQSTLTPKGPIYTPIKEFPLLKGDRSL